MSRATRLMALPWRVSLDVTRQTSDTWRVRRRETRLTGLATRHASKGTAFMPSPHALLVLLSRQALGLNQAGLADLLGSSLRTVQRWEAGRSTPYSWNLEKLADAVRPHNPELASKIDVWAPRPAPPAPPGMPVAAAPMASPPPPLPPPAPPPPVIPAGVLVDAVVCAAAEAMTAAPQAVRPAVLAAFARARDAGLTVDGVLAVLAPPPPAEPVAAKGKAGKTASR
jgi:hypothetical protein